MMRNPLEYYKEEIEKIQKENHPISTTQEQGTSEQLSEEDIIKRNEFIMDFIVTQ
jgi:hypothetical protein